MKHGIDDNWLVCDECGEWHNPENGIICQHCGNCVDLDWVSARLAAIEAENAELRDALKGLMDEAVKMAEKYLPDNAPIWAWIDDASDAITKVEGGNNG
jgi:hypothetical protein